MTSNFDVTSNDLEMRLEKWIWASFGIHKIEPAIEMLHFIQMLGIFDQQLIKNDEIIIQPNYNNTLSYHSSFSRLWVLGCYELTKAIYERCRIDHTKPIFKDYPKCSTNELNQKVKESKEFIERVRIPLAKFESYKKNPSDSPIAESIIILNVGVGWKLSDNYIVSRRQISDTFLNLLITIRDDNFLKH